MATRLFLTILAALHLALPSLSWSGTVQLKVATLAPEGTELADILKGMKEKIKKRTQGRVELVTYLGGVMGNDHDVIKKLKLGQVHLGAFSTLGTRVVCPESKVLAVLPFRLDSYEELDKAKALIGGRLKSYAERHGFQMLAILEQGYNQLYTKTTPVRSPHDAASIKVCTWDDVGGEILQAIGTRPIPISEVESIPALRSGMLDATPGPAVWVLGTQTFTLLKYVNFPKWYTSIASVAMTKKGYESLARQLSKEDFEGLLGLIKEIEPVVVRKAREVEEKSLAAFQEYGMEVVKLTPEEYANFRQATSKVPDRFVGKDFPKELLDEVMQVVH
jgi:TRAP-type C4-dicarboxylate transport system substrate-binding protein